MNRCFRLLGMGLALLSLAAVTLRAADSRAKQTAKPAAEKKTAAAKQKDAAKKTPEKPASQPAATPEATAKKTEKPADKKPEKEPPATVTLKRKPLKITVELEGVFEADSAHEIVLHPEEWNTLVVETAVSHGATVRKGDVLLKLETPKLDQAIADLRADLNILEVAVQQGEQQSQALEKTVALDLKAGRRAARIAKEDQKFFFDVARPFEEKLAGFQVKVAKQGAEYEQEELRQLEKMYKADDITEETEEIVLRRARDTVERAKFSLDMAQLLSDYTLKFSLPRRDDEVKEAAERITLDAAKREVDLPLAQRRQRLELEKLRMQRAQSEERLRRLQADRTMMTVAAPADGIIYYGKLSRGRTADATSLADSLRPHGSVAPNQVVMTLVEPRPMAVRVTVPENQLHDLRPNLSATVIPTGYPDEELSASIDTVGDIPLSPGNFDGRLRVDLTSGTKLLRPGMTCKVKLVPYRKPDAICVPPSALVTDELDEHKQSVQVLEKDGKTTSRSVTVGRKTEKQIEIVKGLAEGEKVVLEPKDEK